MGTTEPTRLPQRIGLLSVTQRLIKSPGLLLLSMLLAGAIFRPYAGIVHDARLYAVQVLDHLHPEVYSNDLFLKYGSQDKYSLFSQISGPMAAWIGVPTAFFLLYLGGNALWLLALTKFNPALLRQRLAAVAALIYMAVNPLPFGGWKTFHVNENFLTPRIWAVALVVLALERLLANRHIASLACVVLSMLLHPIMGFSGFCIWVAYEVMSRMKPVYFAGGVLAVLVVTTSVLSFEPLGTAVFGHMDAQWRHHATDTNPYGVPTSWQLADWAAVAMAFAIVTAGRMWARLPANSRRLLDCIMLLAAIGLAVGLVAPFLPYRLLLQGQAYRALWPLQMVQIPVLFALLELLLRRQMSKVGVRVTVAVLVGFAVLSLNPVQLVTIFLLVVAAYCRQLSASSSNEAQAVAFHRYAMLALCLAIALGVLVVGTAYVDLMASFPPLERLAALPASLGPILIWAMAASLLFALGVILRNRSLYGGVAVCGWLGLNAAFFLIPNSSLYASIGGEEMKDISFVEGYLNTKYARTSETPVLYWALAPIEQIWIDLQCSSFYSIPQTAGNMFNRGTAIEGDRRAKLTQKFELDIRRPWLAKCEPHHKQGIKRIFGAVQEPPPTVEDLIAICQDENIDLVIVPNEFDGWYAATNGHLFIYDAQRIRNALDSNRALSYEP